MTANFRRQETAGTAVEQEHDLFRSLYDTAPEPMFLVDSDFRITYANDCAREVLGERMPATALGLVEAPDESRFQLILAQCRLFQKSRLSIEAQVRQADGQLVWMIISVRSIDDAGTNRIFLRLQDIDRRRRVDQAMKEAEDRWNSALVSSGLGVWDHNIATGDYYYSDTWRAMRGIPAGEPIDASVEAWIQGVHPDDRAYVLDMIEKQDKGVIDRIQFEYRERHRDGHWIWIECRGAIIERDENGNPLRIVGTDTDISERKDVEERLAQATERLKLALDISQIGVFEADLETGRNLWDERLRAIYGIPDTPAEQDGSRWYEFVHPDDLERVSVRVEEGTRSATVITNEFRIIRSDGAIRHIRARVRPVTVDGQVRHYIGANWDVTEDIEIREALEHAKREAEEKNRELELAKARIEHDAMHDHLTGLANRRYLDMRLAELNRNRGGMAILHVDLDRFKDINDTFGHSVGDAVLVHAAALLRRSTTADDFIARVGGDEFVILSPFGGDSGPVTAIAERIIAAFAEPFEHEGRVSHIGASIGIACDAETIDPARVMLDADIALYKAKGQGRNRFEMFVPDLSRRASEERSVTRGIRPGLRHREFFPFYQPVFNAATQAIAGVEALARWRRPSRGMVEPESFLTAAASIGAVAEIDAQLLEQAVTDYRRWTDMGIDIGKVSVNISAQRLAEPDLAERVARFGMPRGVLVFELLETVFLDDPDPQTLQSIAALKQAGVSIAIDDFGTGHASLAAIQAIEPNSIKIARPLIRAIALERRDRDMVAALINIAHDRAIKVVAEGVETRDQVRLLTEMNCDFLQGFALSSPMPFDQLTAFAGTRKR